MLNRANAILTKSRPFIDRKTLKPIHDAIFETQCYFSLVWPQNLNSTKRLFDMQKKSSRIICLQNRNAYSLFLY